MIIYFLVYGICATQLGSDIEGLTMNGALPYDGWSFGWAMHTTFGHWSGMERTAFVIATLSMCAASDLLFITLAGEPTVLSEDRPGHDGPGNIWSALAITALAMALVGLVLGKAYTVAERAIKERIFHDQ